MLKSKRNKLVTPSKTKKRARGQKESLVKTLRECMDDYISPYVFTFENMRNDKFKELREQLKSSSRFFLGSNKILQIALSKTSSDEVKEGVHKTGEMLHGERGLFLTNLSKEEVSRIFAEFVEHDFACTGSIAIETVKLDKRPLVQFNHDMEPFLHKQGLPIRLNRGVIELVSDNTVCQEGEHISPKASRTLRLPGIRMAAFRLHLICRWSPREFDVYKPSSEITMNSFDSA